MSRVKVPLADNLKRVVFIDTEANAGAQIGVDLRDPNGVVLSLDQLRQLFNPGANPNPVADTLWRLVREIPNNVREVERLATVGIVVRRTDGTWVTRSIAIQADGLLELEDGDGDDGNPRLGAADIDALSAWGRAADTSGKPAPIVAGIDGQLLIRRGTALQFDLLADGDIPAGIARDTEITAAIAAHVADANPHPVYLTQPEADALYAAYSTGTFTVTLTGCTTAPTATMHFVKCSGSVVLSLETSLTATSNATTATLTGMPAPLFPARTQTAVIRISDNGVSAFGLAELDTSGVITLYATAGGGAFAAAGVKGILRTAWPYLAV